MLQATAHRRPGEVPWPGGTAAEEAIAAGWLP
jgi:hypothetical protein